MSVNHDFVEILQPQIDQGLQLWLEGDALRFKAPQDLMTADLMQVLKSNKESIREWLKYNADNPSEDGLIASNQKQVMDEFALASTQAAIWMLYRLAPNSPAYNTAFVATTQSLDTQAVKQALQALFIRHPVLRSTFVDTDTGPRQQVWNYVDIPFAKIDASDWSESELQAALKAEADAAFDLQNESCLRVKIFTNSVLGDVLVATVHHIGADLWALLIIAQEIKQFYEQASLGLALEIKQTEFNYHHHVDWQQQYLISDAGKRAQDYWQRQLQSAPTNITLPIDKCRPPMLAMQTELHTENLTGEYYQQVKAFCKSNSITPFVFVQSAFQLLVHHLTDADDFLVGTPTMGRSQAGMDKVVGDFANPVVLRARLNADKSVKSLYKNVQQTLLLAMEFQDYPFPAVVQDCNPPRDTSRTPLFQLMFVWHQGNPDAVLKDGFIKEVLPLSGPRGAPYDVLLAISDLGNQFDFNWTYQSSLYEFDTIKYFQGLLLELIQGLLTASPDAAVGEILKPLNVTNKRSLIPTVCQDTTERIKSALPAFSALDAITLLQPVEPATSEVQKTLKRFFIAANEQLVTEASPYLRQFCDDVVALPQLPRNSLGDWDLLALAKIPGLNQKTLQKKWNELDLVASDWQSIHRHNYLPSFSKFEYQDLQKTSKANTGLSVVTDLQSRPDAWVKTQPLLLKGDEPKTLIQALQRTADVYPDKGIYFIDEQILASESALLPQQYSYRKLWQDAQHIAAGINALCLASDTIVLLQMSVSPRYFATWWAVLLNGLRPLNVAIPDNYHRKNGVAQKLQNVAHNFNELVVIADHDKVAATDSWLQTKQVIAADSLYSEQSTIAVNCQPNDTAFLQLTSGSTGTPKAIQITHGGILHHIFASAHYNHYQADNLTLNWLPFDHVVPMLTFHLKDVVLGINQIQVPTTAILAEPLRWPELMSRYQVTHSWAPNFAYQRVLDALKQSHAEHQWDLKSLQFLMNAGEQVLPESVKGFQGALATYGLQNSAVQPAFGMAEACTCMTYNNDSQQTLERHISYGSDKANTPNLIDLVPIARASHHFIDLGSVVPGVEVRITDDNNRLVKEGVIGRMQIRGPVITPGYLNNEEANTEAFVGDGWFNSGDLGFIWQGRLTLTGREKEMIVVNGANYYCFEIEHLVADLSGVLPTYVAATAVHDPQDPQQREALAVFYVADDSEAAEFAALEKAIVARVTEGFSIIPRYVIRVERDDFYKTTSGKIQRSQFKKQFNSGYYQAQIDAYLQQDQSTVKPLQQGFTWSWHCQSSGSVSALNENTVVTFSMSVFDEDTADKLLKFLSADYSADKVIELGDFSGAAGAIPGSVAANPAGVLQETTWQLTRKLKLISQILVDGLADLQSAEHGSGVITLVMFSEQQSDLMLLQPLVETLRQESGSSGIGCVLTPRSQATDLESYRGITAIGWWQGERFFQQQLENLYVPINKNPATVAKGLKRNGVYLVTGGLGALAEHVVRWLVDDYNAIVLLSGRSNLLGSDSHQRSVSQLTRLKTELGADNIHYLHLPTWQEEELALRIDDALSTLEQDGLDGVFHLAGLMELQSLAAMDRAHWDRVLDAKVSGSNALAGYLQSHCSYSLLVQFGSVNGLFGGQSGAAYSVANAYQAQLTSELNRQYQSAVAATRQRAKGLVQAWCIHWSFWQQTGMARTLSEAEMQMAKNKGFLPLKPVVDDIQLARFLALPADNYLMGIDPDNASIAPYVNQFKNIQHTVSIYVDISALDSMPESVKLQQDIQRHWQEPIPQCQSTALKVHISEEPYQRTEAEFLDIDAIVASAQSQQDLLLPDNDIELQVALVWQQVLGRDIDNVERTFFEYGGHSINATQVIAALNQRMASQLTVADLFQHSTVRALAQFLAGHNATSKDFLSLTVADCLARADSYRMDKICQGNSANAAVVFLPTASGIPSVYWGMISCLKDYDCYGVSLPIDSGPIELGPVNSGPIAASAQGNSLTAQATQIATMLKQQLSQGRQCVLVGWSYAGVLAAELSGLLQDYFAQAPHLIMLDSGFSQGLHEITFDSDFQLLMFAVELGLETQQFAEFNQQQNQDTKLHWLHQQVAYLNQQFSPQSLAAYWQLYEARLAALLHHREPALNSAVQSHQLVANLHSHGRQDLGWENAQQTIQWHSIDADHQSIVKHPATISWIIDYLREHKGR